MRGSEPTLKPFALLRWSFNPNWSELLILAASLVCVWCCELAIPFLLGRSVDAALSPGDPAANIRLIGLTLAATTVLYCTHRLYLTKEARLTADATFTLRGYIYRRILEQPLDFLANGRSGEIADRIMADSDVIDRHGIYLFADLPYSLLTATGVFVAMLVMQPKLAVVVAVTLVGAAVAVQRIGQPLEHTESLSKRHWSRLGGMLHESLTGIRTIKAFRRESDAVWRLDVAARELTNAEIRTGTIAAKLEPLLEQVKVLGFLAIVCYGAYLVRNGALTAGKLIAFIAYMERMSEPLQDSGRYVLHYQQAKASLTRIVDLLKSLQSGSVSGKDSADQPAEVELLDVTVISPERITASLDGISLTARVGEIVALVGPNGAGKTTLADVVAGLRKPNGGHVRIGGIPLAEWDPAALRKVIAVVPQDIYLFRATLAENIRYGASEASDAEIEQMARELGLDGLLCRLPNGLLTIVGGPGCALSGGERQRVGLARALLRRPRILIVDEGSAALDHAALGDFKRMVAAGRSERITFIISHDREIIRMADRIVQLESGRMICPDTSADCVPDGGAQNGQSQPGSIEACLV